MRGVLQSVPAKISEAQWTQGCLEEQQHQPGTARAAFARCGRLCQGDRNAYKVHLRVESRPSASDLVLCMSAELSMLHSTATFLPRADLCSLSACQNPRLCCYAFIWLLAVFTEMPICKSVLLLQATTLNDSAKNVITPRPAANDEQVTLV